MSENLPVIHEQPLGDVLSAKDMKTRVQRIQEVMKAVMIPDTHYGVIPGTKNKPSLYKAGAEVLVTMFGITIDPEIEDLSVRGEEVRYRIRCKGLQRPHLDLLGVGVGEASTAEEKYQWRAAVCDDEYDATEENLRREKYSKRSQQDGGGFNCVKQIRTNPSDYANTVLKMAKKRALIDMTLTVLGASDIFTQDLEDREDDDDDQGKPRGPKMPERKSSGEKRPSGQQGDGRPASEGQKRMIYAKLKDAQLSPSDFEAAFGTAIEALRWIDIDPAIALIEKGW